MKSMELFDVLTPARRGKATIGFVYGSAVLICLFAMFVGSASAAEQSRQRVRFGVSSKSIGFFDTWVGH
ncbi:MAG TPA: hypothetical protein VLA17_13610, partial [Candidatus Limnocylindria bacterium]|nr:hypothetical protein [Candidatus Limnocylindria bacterium]